MVNENDGIEKLELPYRIYNLLKRNNFNTVYDLLSVSLKELSKMDGFGKYAIKEIKIALDNNKLNLANDKIDNFSSITSLNLSRKAVNSLLSSDITTVGQLLGKDLFELSAIPNVGINTISEIVISVYQNGFKFKNENSYMCIFPYINSSLRKDLLDHQKSNIDFEQIVSDKKKLLLLLRKEILKKEALIQEERKIDEEVSRLNSKLKDLNKKSGMYKK